MKNTNFKKSLVLLAVLSFLNGCKYEEGPAISLRSKKARVENSWSVEKFIDAEGVSYDDPFPDAEYTFTKDGKFTLKDNSGEIAGTWVFSESKKNIILSYTQGAVGSDEYRILKLKDKEFWFQNILRGEYHLMEK